MECGKKGKKYQLIVFVLAVLLAMASASITEAKTSGSLINDVISLKLGLSGYMIGVKLNNDQKKIGEDNPLEGAYEGTYKFKDNDLNVVVDADSDRVLALYKQKKEADTHQLKAMVSELMSQFATPTTMAHEKIIYWAFNKHGVVSEEDFKQAKKINQTSGLNIIGTVKLNSEMEITPDPKEEEKNEAAENETETGSMYFIITSDPLVKEFMAAFSQ